MQLPGSSWCSEPTANSRVTCKADPEVVRWAEQPLRALSGRANPSRLLTEHAAAGVAARSPSRVRARERVPRLFVVEGGKPQDGTCGPNLTCLLERSQLSRAYGFTPLAAGIGCATSGVPWDPVAPERRREALVAVKYPRRPAAAMAAQSARALLSLPVRRADRSALGADRSLRRADGGLGRSSWLGRREGRQRRGELRRCQLLS